MRRTGVMPRRPHTKTRSGCTTCKARKVRCDEQKPTCQNCTRGDRVCRYPIHLLDIPTGGGSPAADQQLFPARDLELMHYWTSRTYTTMTQHKEQFDIWRDYVPSLAFKYKFLLHGMLAVTALHKRFAEYEPGTADNLLDLARYHQQHALVLYIPLLKSIDEDNCHALFAFSVLLSILCFSFLLDDSTEKSEDDGLISRFIETCDALHGSLVVAIEAREWLHNGEMHRMMEDALPVTYEFSKFEPGLAAALEELLTCARREPQTPKQNAYMNAIYGLATILSLTQVYQVEHSISHIVAWPIVAGVEYCNLLRQRDPLALVILGHYSLALSIQSDLWMLQGGLSWRLVNAVSESVDETWAPYLAWVKSQVGEQGTPSLAHSDSTTPSLMHSDSATPE